MKLFRFLSLIVLCAVAISWTPLVQASTHAKPNKKNAAYGAIAYHRDTGSHGFSYDKRNAREASVEALTQCAHPNCEVVISIRDACGALAGSKSGFGAVQGATRAEAETKSMKKCGAGCTPITWACTR